MTACALSSSGCSLAISGPDPDRPRNEVPKCDTGKGAVGLDGLMTSLLGLGSLASFAEGETGAGAALGAFAGLFLASAVRGNNAANECRAAFDDYNVAYHRMQQEEREPVGELRRPITIRGKGARPVAEPAPATAVPAAPATEAPTEAPTAAPEPPIAPEYASPRPVKPPEPKQAEPARPAKPAPRPSAPDDEDWGAFWKEAP